MGLPENLRDARDKRGITQQQAADSLSVSVGTISGYERGHRKPDVVTLKSLSLLYGVSVDALLDNDPQEIRTYDAANKLTWMLKGAEIEREAKPSREQKIFKDLDDEDMDILEKIAEGLRIRKKLPPDEQAESNS